MLRGPSYATPHNLGNPSLSCPGDANQARFGPGRRRQAHGNLAPHTTQSRARHSRCFDHLLPSGGSRNNPDALQQVPHTKRADCLVASEGMLPKPYALRPSP